MLETTFSNRKDGTGRRARKFLGKWTGFTFLKEQLKSFFGGSLSHNHSRNDDETEEALSVQMSHLSVEGTGFSRKAVAAAVRSPEKSGYEDCWQLIQQLLAMSHSGFEYCEEHSYHDYSQNAGLSSNYTCMYQPSHREDGHPFTSTHYRFIRTIGRGSFAKVKLAHLHGYGRPVAIKMVSTQTISQDHRMQRILAREIGIMQKVRGIRGLVGLERVGLVFEQDQWTQDQSSCLPQASWICLEMEWVSGGELFDWVAARKRLSETDARPILAQVLQALSELHTLGITHRDLKLENILLDLKGDQPTAKIIDFGLAQFMHRVVSRKRHSSNSDRRDESFLHDPVLSKHLLHTRCGSEEYAAPEILQGCAYDGTLSDAWSFGICMYACLVGSLPFNPDIHVQRDGEAEDPKSAGLIEKILNGSFVLTDEMMSSDAASLIRGLLQVDPSKRLSIVEAKRHCWFRNSEMNKVVYY